VSYNSVRRIENLGHLSQLKRLFLANNKIKVIANLDGMPLLEMLELGANRIREIQNLPDLPLLRSLYLGKNKITELAGLAHLTALRVLSVQSNRLTKWVVSECVVFVLSCALNAVQLHTIWTSHLPPHLDTAVMDEVCAKVVPQTTPHSKNPMAYMLSRIEGLDGLVNLEELYLSHNGITRIERLDTLVRPPFPSPPTHLLRHAAATHNSCAQGYLHIRYVVSARVVLGQLSAAAKTLSLPIHTHIHA